MVIMGVLLVFSAMVIWGLWLQVRSLRVENSIMQARLGIRKTNVQVADLRAALVAAEGKGV
jgi:hypothetical protein